MGETCKQWNLLSDLDCPWYPCCAVFFFFIETGHWDLLLTKPVYFLFRHFLLERLVDWKLCFLFYLWKNLSFFTSLNSVNLISWFATSLPVFVVQLLSRVQLFATPWTAARQASLPFTISRNLLKLLSVVGDAIQPSCPLSSPSPAFYLSQHQGLFQWVSSSHQVAKVLKLQHLPMNIQDWFPLGWTDLISLQSRGLSKGLSKVFSNTEIQKHQFLGAQPSLWSNSHICMWLLEKS